MAKKAQRMASAAKHSMSSGRLPELSARRPTQGAMAATTNCGAKIQTDKISVAVCGRRWVRRPAMVGSAAALASWNRKIAAEKTRSGRLKAKTRAAPQPGRPSCSAVPPRARSGSMSCD